MGVRQVNLNSTKTFPYSNPIKNPLDTKGLYPRWGRRPRLCLWYVFIGITLYPVIRTPNFIFFFLSHLSTLFLPKDHRSYPKVCRGDGNGPYEQCSLTLLSCFRNSDRDLRDGWGSRRTLDRRSQSGPSNNLYSWQSRVGSGWHILGREIVGRGPLNVSVTSNSSWQISSKDNECRLV